MSKVAAAVLGAVTGAVVSAGAYEIAWHSLATVWHSLSEETSLVHIGALLMGFVGAVFGGVGAAFAGVAKLTWYQLGSLGLALILLLLLLLLEITGFRRRWIPGRSAIGLAVLLSMLGSLALGRGIGWLMGVRKVAAPAREHRQPTA